MPKFTFTLSDDEASVVARYYAREEDHEPAYEQKYTIEEWAAAIPTIGA